jgi:hypothetical protein
MNVIVVGNSSALLERSLGPRIDAFDRIVASTRSASKYEKYVGGRVDIVGTGRIATVWRQDPATMQAASEVWMKRPLSYARLDEETQRVVTHFSIPDEKLRYPDEKMYGDLARRLVEATNRNRPWWRLPSCAEKRPGPRRTLALQARRSMHRPGPGSSGPYRPGCGGRSGGTCRRIR